MNVGLWWGADVNKLCYSSTMMTDTEIANGWIAEISVNNGVVDPDRCVDVAMVLDDVIHSNPERAWAIITMMSQTTMSRWALENYCAGPLTTFVSQHGKHSLSELGPIVACILNSATTFLAWFFITMS
jgi:hypothetical protein